MYVYVQIINKWWRDFNSVIVFLKILLLFGISSVKPKKKILMKSFNSYHNESITCMDFPYAPMVSNLMTSVI